MTTLIGEGAARIAIVIAAVAQVVVGGRVFIGGKARVAVHFIDDGDTALNDVFKRALDGGDAFFDAGDFAVAVGHSDIGARALAHFFNVDATLANNDGGGSTRNGEHHLTFGAFHVNKARLDNATKGNVDSLSIAFEHDNSELGLRESRFGVRNFDAGAGAGLQFVDGFTFPANDSPGLVAGSEDFEVSSACGSGDDDGGRAVGGGRGGVFFHGGGRGRGGEVGKGGEEGGGEKLKQ